MLVDLPDLPAGWNSSGTATRMGSLASDPQTGLIEVPNLRLHMSIAPLGGMGLCRCAVRAAAE